LDTRPPIVTGDELRGYDAPQLGFGHSRASGNPDFGTEGGLGVYSRSLVNAPDSGSMQLAPPEVSSPRYTFTVFTATYNRAYTLPRVYHSLCSQTFRDFEWLIVDDGSTDNTPELISQWQNAGNLPIRYLRQENRGRHVAFNRGVREAQGALFLNCDSDDACVPHALERFMYHWENIPLTERDGFSAVTALCMDTDGKIMGDKFPRD